MHHSDALLEIALENAVRITSHMELSRFLLVKSKDEKSTAYPFAYISTDEDQSIKKKLRSVLDRWIVQHLRPFAIRHKVSSDMVDRVEILMEEEALYQISYSKSIALPWSQHPTTGTTRPQKKNGRPDSGAYRALVEHCARQITGHEIFNGLGPLKRVVLGYRSLNSNAAELMTEPVSIDNNDQFSLVITLSVETIPALSQPLLKIDISKRRWINALKAPKFRSDNIIGYMFSEDVPDRVFSFRLLCNKSQKAEGKHQWEWKPGESFSVLCQQFNLSLEGFTGQEISVGNANSDTCKFVLTYRNGLGSHSIGAGVPEIDKLEAFEKIAQLLEPSKLLPLESHNIPNRNKAGSKETSREINLPTLINGILQLSDQDLVEIESNYTQQLSDHELSCLLRERINFSPEEIIGGTKALQIKTEKFNQTNSLKVISEENQKALRRIYPGEKIRIIIFYRDGLQKQAALLTHIVHCFWGQSLKIWKNSLDKEVHGPRIDLPDNDKNNKQRSQARVKKWSQTSKSISENGCRTFCLILAEEFCQNSKGKPAHDDRINKPSTYRALAGDGGACVQFLLPMERSKKGCFNLEDFARRSQQALKDLLSAHSGRVDEIKGKVNKGLSSISVGFRPKEIISIAIICKQKGRIKGRIQPTLLPVATRLDVETGRCEIRYAYDENNNLTISPWRKFPDALSLISRISPIKLARKTELLSTRFAEFVDHVISESVDSGAQPLVILDSTNCSQLWHWLRDRDLDAKNITLGTKRDMGQSWAGARIVRIRREISPGIVEQKERRLYLSNKEDNRTKDELKQLTSDLRLPSAASPTGLFRLTPHSTSGCVTYLSIGSVRQKFRGLSCYRSIQAIANSTITNVAGLELSTLSTRDPHTDQWPTPNPLEIVVTLRQEKDNPDHIAALVESLRYVMGHYGEATTLPAPLFFERVVRDYVSDFAIEEKSEDEEL